mmetsp:Transcript_26324/g.56440  ORF Transcript_26324/g.56440 Transcript_26324/m.56440 type:complete len:253 (-) Transcript_26324:1316-2074(-)
MEGVANALLHGRFAHELHAKIGGKTKGPQKLDSDQYPVPRAGAVDADERLDTLSTLEEGQEGQTDPQDTKANKFLDGVLARIAFQEKDSLGNLFGVHEDFVSGLAVDEAFVGIRGAFVVFVGDEVGNVGRDLNFFATVLRRGGSGSLSDLGGGRDRRGLGVFAVGGGGQCLFFLGGRIRIQLGLLGHFLGTGVPPLVEGFLGGESQNNGGREQIQPVGKDFLDEDTQDGTGHFHGCQEQGHVVVDQRTGVVF